MTLTRWLRAAIRWGRTGRRASRKPATDSRCGIRRCGRKHRNRRPGRRPLADLSSAAQETTDCLALVETTLLIEGLGMTTTTAAVASTFVSVSLRSRGRRAARLPVIGDRASIPEKTGLLPVEFLTMITGATRRTVVLAPVTKPGLAIYEVVSDERDVGATKVSAALGPR